MEHFLIHLPAELGVQEATERSPTPPSKVPPQPRHQPKKGNDQIALQSSIDDLLGIIRSVVTIRSFQPFAVIWNLV